MDLNIATVVVAAAVGAYLGAYLKRKGENLATREDLAQITRTTEAIKAQISSDIWDRQRRWETKREVLFDLVRALDASSRQLCSMLAVFRTTLGDDFDETKRAIHRKKAREEWMIEDDTLERAVALAGIVSGPELRQSLIDVSQEMKRMALEALRDENPEPVTPDVQRKVYRIMAAVRLELQLGDVEPDSMPRGRLT